MASAVVTTHSAVAENWLGHAPAHLAGLVTQHASGPAGQPHSVWLGQVGKGDGGGDNPTLWRIGTAQLHGYRHNAWPVAIPLLDEAHLQVTSTPGTRTTAEALVEQLVLRVLSTYRPGLVHIHVWDAAEQAGSLRGLYPLWPEGLLNIHDPTDLAGLLDELGARITTIRTRVQALGHRSLLAEAHAENGGTRTEPWTLAVLLGNGEPLDARTSAALQRLARGALHAGISLLTVDVPVAFPACATTVTFDGRRNRCSMTGRRARFNPDLPAAETQVAQACRAIAQAYADWRLRKAVFRDLLPEVWGGQSSIDGLVAPVGFDVDNNPITVALGDAAPHCLVGGPSGTGKTNFILAMVMALATRYSPDQLALYMLDFKEGVSFAPLANERFLPHARLVGVNINEDCEFGLALLRFLQAEMVRRAAAARKVGAVNLQGLRKRDPEGHWPRILAVIDEFQKLFEDRHDAVTKEAVTLLEDIARRGRSNGIHMVLASQDVDGIKPFWGCPGVFRQFLLRVGLKQAKGVLDRENKATLELPDYHAVVNAESGFAHGNQIARIPDASSAGTAEIAQDTAHHMWADGLEPPVLLDGGAEIPACTLRPWLRKAPTAVVGRAFTVDAAPAAAVLDAAVGRNVVVLGSGTREAPTVLSCAAAGIAAQGIRVDLAAFETVGAAHVDWVHAGDNTTVVSAADFAAHVADLVREIGDRLNGAPRTPRALAIWEVDAMETRYPEPVKTDLKTVLRLGPEVGVHVLGWWRSVVRLQKLLVGRGPIAPDDLGVWAVCDAIGTEIGGLIPDRLAVGWEPRPRRGWLYDRRKASQGRQLFVIPTLNGSA